MREIKFRVWDNEENKFFEPIYEAYKGNLLDLSITLSGELCERTLKHCSKHESMFPNKYILEQYTGLKDKNGKEIYEGDIIKGFNEFIGVVRHEGASFWFISKSGGGLLTAEYLENFEIIGNIHKNKDLI